MMVNENLQDSFTDLSEAVMTDSEQAAFEGVQENMESMPVMNEHIAAHRALDVSKIPPTTDLIIRTRLGECQATMDALEVVLKSNQATMRGHVIEHRKLLRLVAVLDRIDANSDDTE